MKYLASLLTLFAILFAPVFADDAAAGDPGVEDGTCWKGGGHDITIKERGNLMGESVVTVSDGTNSGEGAGTPDPDGGCAEGPPIKVGDTYFRVDGGEMQYKDSAGNWKDMTEKKCPKKKAIEINGGGAPATDQGGGDDGSDQEMSSGGGGDGVNETIGGWPIDETEHVDHP